MSFKQEATEIYIQYLLENGITEEFISLMVIAFETGFGAGAIDEDDYVAQEKLKKSMRRPVTLN